MSTYTIIDEPKPRPQEHLIVNPVIILLAGMILPLVWNPPVFGRIWMPLLWICLNGFLLGSPTLKKEIVISLVGALLWFMLPYAVVLGLQTAGQQENFTLAAPYIRIASQGIFFITLYLVCIKQMLAYEIFTYLRENKR